MVGRMVRTRKGGGWAGSEPVFCMGAALEWVKASGQSAHVSMVLRIAASQRNAWVDRWCLRWSGDHTSGPAAV